MDWHLVGAHCTVLGIWFILLLIAMYLQERDVERSGHVMFGADLQSANGKNMPFF